MPRLAPTDVDLCRYMDGECEPDEREAIEKALREHPEAARQLAIWRNGDTALRLAFGATRLNRDERAATESPRVSALGPLQAGDLARARGRVAVAALAAFISGALFTLGAFALLHLGRAH